MRKLGKLLPGKLLPRTSFLTELNHSQNIISRNYVDQYFWEWSSEFWTMRPKKTPNLSLWFPLKCGRKEVTGIIQDYAGVGEEAG